MSHFITLLENALKSGNRADPVFREGVYKGALRAFDKMSDQRPDRVEFRKLHGPQLAEAITRVEQKYVTFDDEEPFNSEVNSSAALGHDVEFPNGLDASPVPGAEHNVQQSSGHFDGSIEPPVANFDDDVFLNEEDRAIKSRSKGQISNKLIIGLGVVTILVILGLLIWLFL